MNSFYYPDMKGGTELSLKLLAEGLVEAGNQVACFCLNCNQKAYAKENVNGVTVYRSSGGMYTCDRNKLNFFTSFLNKAIFLNNFPIKGELADAIQDFMPDVVHSNNLTGISIVVWDLCVKRNIPIVHTVRDMFLDKPWLEKKRHGGAKILADLTETIGRKVSVRMSKKVAVATAATNFMLDYYASRGYFPNAYKERVLNSVDMSKWDKNALYRPYRETTYFIYAGVLSFRKGILFLLEAFSEIQGINARLKVFGDGELVTRVREYADKYSGIEYCGNVSNSELMQEYQKADVAVVPSMFDEAFGRVIIEAGMMGCSVIATNRGGMPEVLDILENGDIYDWRDKEKLKQAIIRNCDYSYRREKVKNIDKNIIRFSQSFNTNNMQRLYARACLGGNTEG